MGATSLAPSAYHADLTFDLGVRMQAGFWHDKWERRDIGFHQSVPNELLRAHWPALGLKSGERVFVPLAGKSLDMLWLAGEGLRVLGVELSSLACEAFFAENGLTPTRTEEGPFTRWSCAEVELLCGDVFALERAQLADVHGIYDRAALIALPLEMRRRYVEHLSGVLPAAVRMLLITLDYEQSERQGPPFAVSADEVRALYAGWDLSCLQTVDLLERDPRYRERGLSRISDCAWRVCRS